MIELEIDGQKFEAEQGSMIIEVTDANNIHVPRFCYHKELSVAANCRMCLVEVDKMPKTVPACATPVTPGMKIFTQSQKTRASQQAVMEFLLINHPLDCPICDQGGECELQDNSMNYGLDYSPYEETKRVITDKNIGPLIQTNLTRCIQCTRCVRFGQEVAGIRELGMTQRGEHSEIRTFVERALTSEVSGNIIDLCPVGALTSKPFLYKARPWELEQAESVAPHDAFGSNIYLHTRRNKVMRVVPHENESINKMWLSDRDRFSYTALEHPERLLAPMVKRDGQWHATDWETALNFAVAGISATQEKHGAETLLTLSSPSATLEEYYLLAQLIQSIGAKAISYHLRDTDLRDQTFLSQPYFPIAIADIEQLKSVLIIGSEITRELPLMALRLRKAVLSGASVHLINPADFPVNFSTTNKIIHQPHQAIDQLSAIAAVLLKNTAMEHPLKSLDQLDLIRNAHITDQHKIIAEHLTQNNNSFIYLGALSFHSDDASLLRLLAGLIARLSNSQWGMHSDGANTTGLAHIHQLLKIPHYSLTDLFKTKQTYQAILLHGIEPELDCAHSYELNQLLQQADIVIACSAFKSDHLLQNANVLLPIASLAETSGSFVNIESKWQFFKGQVKPIGEARPAWRLFRVLADLFQLKESAHNSTQDILDEIKQKINFTKNSGFSDTQLIQGLNDIKPHENNEILAYNELYRMTQWPIYRIDSLVRRAEPLQNSGTASAPAIYLNNKTQQQLGLVNHEIITVEQQSGRTQLSCQLNDTLPDNTALIAAGFTETSALNNCNATIRIIRGQA